MVADVGEDGKQQVVYYEEGVGTGMFDKIGGGLFGLGIDHYIARAYEYLMQTYEDGDEIFIFGFSRGAFMCRSLMGIIDEVDVSRLVVPVLEGANPNSQCGLLRPGTTLKVSQLYDRYRAGANGNPPATLSQILKNRNSYDMATHYVEYMLGQYSRHVKFTYMGIFDTARSVNARPSSTSWADIDHRLPHLEFPSCRLRASVPTR